jgi:hypothetical protein
VRSGNGGRAHEHASVDIAGVVFYQAILAARAAPVSALVRKLRAPLTKPICVRAS